MRVQNMGFTLLIMLLFANVMSGKIAESEPPTISTLYGQSGIYGTLNYAPFYVH